MLNGRPTPLYAAAFEQWFKDNVENTEDIDPLMKGNMKDVFVAGFISSYAIITEFIPADTTIDNGVTEALMGLELREYAKARRAGRSDV